MKEAKFVILQSNGTAHVYYTDNTFDRVTEVADHRDQQAEIDRLQAEIKQLKRVGGPWD